MKARFRPLYPLVVTACAVALIAAPRPLPDSHASSQPSQVESEDLTSDDVLARIGARFPRFGGFFVNETDGEMVVHVTGRSADVAGMRRAIVQGLADPTLGELATASRLSEHPFTDLKDWFDHGTHYVMKMEGVVFADIDDELNRIRIRVRDVETDAPRIRAKLEELGVPPDAVVIEQGEGIRELSSVRDLHRPVVGGLQVQYPIDTTTVGQCTLGFNANRNGVAGFVTNSHCTTYPGGVFYDDFGQPNTATIIGQEEADPAYFVGGECPVDRRCRYSDAAFVRYLSPLGTEYQLGRIAKTPLGAYTWDGVSKFIISDKATASGGTVVKVGRTTGRSNANITQTCAKVNATGTNRTYICQQIADLEPQDGDSGSPVFTSGTTDTRTLVGILWGGDSTSAVFSPWGGIQRAAELGSMKVCAPEWYTC